MKRVITVKILKLFKNVEVYTPESIGKKDILIHDSKIR
jgi:dihydroorotase-like cyclic amidohydrolase